jgi:hypothetical protein
MGKSFRAIPIFGFAYSRSKIAEDLEANVRNIIMHLIKLWRYPNALEVNHWRQEVYNFLNQVGRLKSSNKYPSVNFIMKNTFDVNKPDIPKWLNSISHVYDEDFESTGIREDTELMSERIKEYFEWLASKLSDEGNVFSKYVYSKLKELEFGN